MINPVSTASYIFSKLGNNSSLLPIAVKDAAHSSGMTAASYITGKEVEGKDRFIDEFGTQVIWIGGIPFYKKAIDLTLYKAAKHNPKVDIRLLKNEKVLQKAIKHAPTKEIADSIVKASKNTSTFKALSMTKFIASTLLTLGSYWALTSYRHKTTEQNIIKEIKREEKAKRAAAKEAAKVAAANKQKQTDKSQQNPQSAPQNSPTNSPSFGMNLAGLKDFMFDPVKNMMIVDGGITTERLAESRNPQDFLGYVIKEGAFWAFMYFAGAKIQKYFENRAEKKHNKSINLDIRALQDSELKEALQSKKLMNSVNEIKSVIKIETTQKINKKGVTVKTDKIMKPEDLYEFICTKKDNLVVKLAKKSDVIKTYKKTGKVDTQQFIDLDEVKGVAEKLENLHKQYAVSGENIEKFLGQTIKLKRLSIIKNIGACMGVLGLIVPGTMLAARYMGKGNTEFQVKKEIHEKMKKDSSFAGDF